MSVESRQSWYSDPDALLATIRQSRRPVMRAPQIAGYKDFREIKRGGQGVVYQAVQISTKRTVAVKVLAGGAFASHTTRRRFEREVDLAASLDHPNIVRIYDSGETPDGQPYYVMEYIEGVPLDALIRTDPDSSRTEFPLRPIDSTLDLFAKICDAVNYAHQRGVIHRDLKPSNIRIDAAGEPHVLDFGLAKMAAEPMNGDVPTQMSMTGDFLGSLPWASPEQAEGQPDEIDVRSDVYSLGVCLYQVLTGRFPYNVAAPFRLVLETIVHTPPQRPGALRPEIDDEVETIVLKCLEKEPERRYQSAGEVGRDLRRYLAGEPIEAKRDSGWYQLRKTLRRYRFAVGSVAAITVASIAAAVAMGVLFQRAEVARHAAVVAKADADASREEALHLKEIAEREARSALEVNRLLTSMLAKPLSLGREARVADILDDTRRALDQNATSDPVVEAKLRDTLGVAYARLAVFDEAERQLDRAFELHKARGEEGLKDLNQTRSSQAWLALLKGNLKESEHIYREVLAEHVHLSGPDSLPVATVSNDLAIVLEALGQYQEAEKLYRKTISFSESSSEVAPGETLNTMGNLASILHSLGRLPEAEKLMRQRLERAIQIYGPEHVDVHTAQNNLSVLLMNMGKLDEALALARVAMEQRSKLLGPEHPESLTSTQNLAAVLESLGQFDEAEKLHRKAAEAMERTLGPEHLSTIVALANVASMLSDRGECEEAIQLGKRVVEYRRRKLGSTHRDTLSALNNLSVCLIRQRRYEEASVTLKESLAGMREVLGPEHQDTLTAELNLAHVLRESGRHAEARALTEHVAKGRLALLGAEHQQTLLAQLDLAENADQEKNNAEAVALASAVVETASRTFGPQQYFTAVALGRLARYQWHAGQIDAAAASYEQAWNAYVAAFGNNHWRINELRQRYVEFCAETGKPLPESVASSQPSGLGDAGQGGK